MTKQTKRFSPHRGRRIDLDEWLNVAAQLRSLGCSPVRATQWHKADRIARKLRNPRKEGEKRRKYMHAQGA
jgi:hypothetical protein